MSGSTVLASLWELEICILPHKVISRVTPITLVVGGIGCWCSRTAIFFGVFPILAVAFLLWALKVARRSPNLELLARLTLLLLHT